MKIKDKERGTLVVEASIVFPIIFLVIFLMIYLGNAFYIKCRIDAIVNEMALSGAAYCADPILSKVEESGLPGYKNVSIKPYRYLLPGGMHDTAAQIESRILDKVHDVGSGLFYHMDPEIDGSDVEVEYNNGIVYSSFSVEANYRVPFPLRMLGEDDNFEVRFSSRVNVPVSDSPEFIRNINMIEDYMEKSGLMDQIDELKNKFGKTMDKVKSWFSSGGS